MQCASLRWKDVCKFLDGKILQGHCPTATDLQQSPSLKEEGPGNASQICP